MRGKLKMISPFYEKLAKGAGFPGLGSKNKSAIHWDILKDMKLPGSKILADDKIIYEEGKWKI
jgi:aminopeptidase